MPRLPITERQPTAAGGERSGDVLLTGATGFVGMEVLARYLERSRRRIVTLVRAADDRAGEHRGRVQTYAADLTSPGLGLEPGVRRDLAGRVSTVVHGAATVSFT